MLAEVRLIGGPADGKLYAVPANAEGEPFFLLELLTAELDHAKETVSHIVVKYLRRKDPNEDGTWDFLYVPREGEGTEYLDRLGA